MPLPSSRVDQLPTYVFAEIAAKLQNLTATGADVIRLDIGNPDMPPDDSIVDELHKHAKVSNNHGYSGYRGIQSFREAVVRFYKKRFNVALDPETEVLPLLGTKEGIVNLTAAYLDDGDLALVPALGYPTYAMGTRLVGGQVCYMPMDADSYLLDLSQLTQQQLTDAKILWVNYPNNPTGAIATQDFYRSLIDICKTNDILLASDNPYVDITYDNYRASSLLEIPDSKDYAVEFFSFSKTYNMAGWRIGAAVGNAEALHYLLKVKSNIDSGHFKAVYQAASFALDTISQEWIDQRNKIYQDRRDMLFNALPQIGLLAQLPKASLYIWAKIPAIFQDDDMNFVNRVLQEAHVSIAPGSAYGPAGEGYVRLALSTPDDRLNTAISRLTEWYRNLKT